MVRIVIDDRERNEGLISILRNTPNTYIEFQRLETGDYLFPNILVERKELVDFCGSIKDGRLFRQASKLSQSIIRPLIIVEVKRGSLRNGLLKIEAIQGALITLSVLFGIPVLRSTSPEETARLMLRASQQIEMFGQRNHRWRRPQPQKNAKSDKRKIQLYVLQGFPGIGVERATKLLDKFGSIRNIINLGAEDLLQTPGFTKNIARGFIELLE